MMKILRRVLAVFVLLVVAYNILIHNPVPTAAPEIAGSIIAVLIACALAWWIWPKVAK